MPPRVHPTPQIVDLELLQGESGGEGAEGDTDSQVDGHVSSPGSSSSSVDQSGFRDSVVKPLILIDPVVAPGRSLMLIGVTFGCMKNHGGGFLARSSRSCCSPHGAQCLLLLPRCSV